ncbi:MAG: dihydrolipoyl dehydrogenase [Planctomycetota bacterium]|jgi:dihydrolipoamide dehydrogenase|nr:dihydrolipoyl dehydrogenase [Planctomycetota bacterium]MEC8433113.1 dihydrolipoyl dehydrogenase [Planctomycetota bacterium]MEC8508269.1 dihydrolipoyl dehydrogenase [Planctomycetota bacterium]MEC8784176.1 dihydrolipoyl dehydrogenase [Planctomycetota bacterium]MEE3076678.1 dihydrolipoyl dehydrogenase [Planctomycetota bacterium]
MSTTHDLVVLGGGPGGYVAAIRAAQLGLNVACIDENLQFGGTCLRVGCIPSKALLESSHLYHQAAHGLAEHGIEVTGAKIDLPAMLKRKDEVVNTLTGGINMLLKRNKVTAYVGRGQLSGPGKLVVKSEDGEQEISAKNIIIATGSKPAMMKGVEFDGDLIGDSTTALSYPAVPKSMIVIGGGYIGLELGSVWSRLGADVTVLEAMDRVLPGLDEEIGRLAHRTFEKQGLKFVTGAWVESATVENGECVVKIKGQEPLTAERVLLCTGRVPNTDSIGLETVGIETDARGTIQIDENFTTSAAGVYAIGDCVPGAMLAHKASEEGIACVEKIVNGTGQIHYDAIPAIVYTHPEIAMVGKTEQQLKEEGTEYRKGMCPYGANGRARAIGDAEGRVKILADAKTDRLLGVHIIGAHAGDLIAEAAVAMTFKASSEDLARCSHAHPTLSEILMEAAMAVEGRAVHT